MTRQNEFLSKSAVPLYTCRLRVLKKILSHVESVVNSNSVHTIREVDGQFILVEGSLRPAMRPDRLHVTL